MRILVVILCVFLGIINLNAQDIHFSQFIYSPLSLNPAHTGNFDGNWRFSNNYRNQWSSVGIPFQTISAGFDKPFRTRRGYVALGFLFLNDRSGSAALHINKAGVSFAYHFRLKPGHYLGFGIQGLYAVQQFSLQDLTFPSQFNNLTGVYDASLPNDINQWDENVNYPDINVGVEYRKNDGKMKPFGGVALFHANKPKVSFLREDNTLNMRVAGNAGINMMLKENLYVEPRLLCMYQKQASDFVAMAEFGYLFPLKSTVERVYVGAGLRTALTGYDALILSGGIGVYHFLVGISYDVNISNLARVSNLRGGFEVTIVYKDIVKTLNQITIPCDRY